MKKYLIILLFTVAAPTVKAQTDADYYKLLAFMPSTKSVFDSLRAWRAVLDAGFIAGNLDTLGKGGGVLFAHWSLTGDVSFIALRDSGTSWMQGKYYALTDSNKILLSKFKLLIDSVAALRTAIHLRARVTDSVAIRAPLWACMTRVEANIVDLYNSIDTASKAIRAFVKLNYAPCAGLDSAFTNGTRSFSTTGRTFVVPDSITSTDIDWATGNTFYTTVSSNTAITFSNMARGQQITLIMSQAGGKTITFPSYVRWPDDVTPTFTTSANKIDNFNFIYHPTLNIVLGFYVQNFKQ